MSTGFEVFRVLTLQSYEDSSIRKRIVSERMEDHLKECDTFEKIDFYQVFENCISLLGDGLETPIYMGIFKKVIDKKFPEVNVAPEFIIGATFKDYFSDKKNLKKYTKEEINRGFETAKRIIEKYKPETESETLFSAFS